MVFIDVIAESLRLSQRSHVFNWLQGELQFLLGHELMIFGIKLPENESYQYEYFTSTRYFNETQFNQVTKQETGIVSQAVKQWKKTASPIFFTSQLNTGMYDNFSVLNMPESELKKSELNNLVAHGFGDEHSKISSFVIFARLHKQPSAKQALILELIMPHLHCALIRVNMDFPEYRRRLLVSVL